MYNTGWAEYVNGTQIVLMDVRGSGYLGWFYWTAFVMGWRSNPSTDERIFEQIVHIEVDGTELHSFRLADLCQGTSFPMIRPYTDGQTGKFYGSDGCNMLYPIGFHKRLVVWRERTLDIFPRIAPGGNVYFVGSVHQLPAGVDFKDKPSMNDLSIKFGEQWKPQASAFSQASVLEFARPHIHTDQDSRTINLGDLSVGERTDFSFCSDCEGVISSVSCTIPSFPDNFPSIVLEDGLRGQIKWSMLDLFTLELVFDHSDTPQIRMSLRDLFSYPFNNGDFATRISSGNGNTVHFSLPMPFWKSVEGSVTFAVSEFCRHPDKVSRMCWERTEFENIKSPSVTCTFDMVHTRDMFDKENTGYLNGASFYSLSQPDRLLSGLDIHGWGHLVRLNMFARQVDIIGHDYQDRIWEDNVYMFIDDNQLPSFVCQAFEDCFFQPNGFARGIYNSDFIQILVRREEFNPPKPFPLPAPEGTPMNTLLGGSRTFIMDPVVFHSHLKVGLEHGSQTQRNQLGNQELFGGAIWYGDQSATPMIITDTFETLGDDAAAHNYTMDPWSTVHNWTGDFFAGGGGDSGPYDLGRFHKRGVLLSSYSSFIVSLCPSNSGVILRKTFRHYGQQRANIYIDGMFSGEWFIQGSNAVLIFSQDDFYISPSLTAGKATVKVDVEIIDPDIIMPSMRHDIFPEVGIMQSPLHIDASTRVWNEIAYQVMCLGCGIMPK